MADKRAVNAKVKRAKAAHRNDLAKELQQKANYNKLAADIISSEDELAKTKGSVASLKSQAEELSKNLGGLAGKAAQAVAQRIATLREKAASTEGKAAAIERDLAKQKKNLLDKERQLNESKKKALKSKGRLDGSEEEIAKQQAEFQDAFETYNDKLGDFSDALDKIDRDIEKKYKAGLKKENPAVTAAKELRDAKEALIEAQGGVRKWANDLKIVKAAKWVKGQAEFGIAHEWKAKRRAKQAAIIDAKIRVEQLKEKGKLRKLIEKEEASKRKSKTQDEKESDVVKATKKKTISKLASTESTVKIGRAHV